MPSSVSPAPSRRGLIALPCAVALVFSASAAQAANFFAQMSSGTGGAANVCIYMTDSGDQVAGVQMDLTWDGACMSAGAKCRANSDTGKTVQSASRGGSTLRAIMLSFDNVDPIPDGELFCCGFNLASGSACDVSITNLIASTPQGQRTTANVRGNAPRPVPPMAGGAPVPAAPQVEAPQARDSGAPAGGQPPAAGGNAPAQVAAADSAPAAADAAPSGDAAGKGAPAGGGAPTGVGNAPGAQPAAAADAAGNVPAGGAQAAAGQAPAQAGEAAAPAAEPASGYAALGEALNAAAIAAKTAAVQTPTPKATGAAATTATPATTAAAAAATPVATKQAQAQPAATATAPAATPTPSEGASAGWLGGCHIAPR